MDKIKIAKELIKIAKLLLSFRPDKSEIKNRADSILRMGIKEAAKIIHEIYKSFLGKVSKYKFQDWQREDYGNLLKELKLSSQKLGKSDLIGMTDLKRV